MKQADPMAKIDVPWALEPSETSGGRVLNSAQRIRTALQQNNLTAAGFAVGETNISLIRQMASENCS